MRTMSLLYTGTLMVVLTLGIICSLTMKSSYAETIRDSLDDSIVYSVKLLQQDRDLVVFESADGTIREVPKQSIDWSSSMGDDEVAKFKSDFVAYMTANLDSRIDNLQVDIYGVDTSVGALSVGVVAEFTYPSGQKDTVESYKTVILNKYVKNERLYN